MGWWILGALAVVVLSETWIKSAVVSADDPCNVGPGCPFSCRCRYAQDTCDPLTGSCTSGCAAGHPSDYGWSGPGCQTGNAAYNQPAWQYGQFSTWSASKSVNGQIDRVGLQDYSHPSGPGQGWWTVDFGKPHKVYQIVYANTAEDSYNYSTSMQFYVGNDPAPRNNGTVEHLLPKYTLCGTRAQIGHSEDAIINCTSPIIGRYVLVYKASKSYKPGSFVMAEVIVKAHIYVSCKGCRSRCNNIYGCIADCPPGKTQSSFCSEDCVHGKYGLRCERDCSGHCKNSALACNPQTGHCDQGCQEWWTLDKCNLQIAPLKSFQGSVQAIPTSDSIQVIWDQLTDIPPELSERYGYKVKIEGLGPKLVPYSASLDKAEATFTNLEHNQYYTAVVTPNRNQNDDIDSFPELSKDVKIKTKCKPPDRPVLVRADVVNTSYSQDYMIQAVEAHWQLGAANGCDVIESVLIQYNTSRSDWDSTKVSHDVFTATVKPYYPGWYHIRVQVTNNEQISAHSDPQLVYIIEYGERPVSGAVVGSVIAVIIILLILIILCCIWRRRRSGRTEFEPVDSENNYKHHKADIMVMRDIPTENDEDSDEDKSPEDDPQTDGEDLEIEHYELKSKDQVYENTSFVLKAIPLTELETELSQRESLEDGLLVEMDMLPGPEYALDEVGKRPENKEKNRFRNIIPFDHSRVVLDSDESFDSDYINASYISGYGDKKNMYVATQGPRQTTVGDFWRMIWKLQAEMIVMLTPLVEHKKGKVLRVTQFHYLAWPDKSVPKRVFPLLAFIHRVRSNPAYQKQPLVVHCSAGVGRTGTYIALDILLNQALKEQAVCIYGCVHRLRTERPRMGQTLNQYILLYKAIIDFAKTGMTSVIQSDFPSHYLQRQTESSGEKSCLTEEYNLLRSLLDTDDQSTAAGTLPENIAKNRYEHIIPPDESRPCLKTRCYRGTDYINASFVDSPVSARGFITTQNPLADTIVDVWRLVYDFKCSMIVMLNELDQYDCPQFWPGPKDSDVSWGPFSLRLDLEELVTTNIKRRELSLTYIKSGDVRPVTVLQLVSGSHDSGDGLLDPAHLLDILEQTEHLQGSGNIKRTLVMCKNGVSRCGVFCAARHLLDQIKEEEKVDIFLAGRIVTSHNHHCLKNEEEYKFLYELASTYISRSDTYANFN